MIALIQKTQRRLGWPFLQQAELQIELSVWNDVVHGIPDAWLEPSWQKAMQDKTADKKFTVDDIKRAYGALIAEHRDQVERERYSAAYRHPDTFRCWMCEDQGYTPLQIYCGSTKAHRRVLRPCSCDMTPISQRLFSIVDSQDWQKNRLGIFEWQGHGMGLPCDCTFCERSRNEPTKNTSNHQNAQRGNARSNHDYSDGEEYF